MISSRHVLLTKRLQNIRFIRHLTPIPVPRVFFAFHIPAWAFLWRRKWYWGEKVPHTSDAYIFMERIDGRSLDAETWLPLDDTARNLILSQLRLFISEMRSLRPPPSAAIGSVLGGAVVDDRLAQGWSSSMDSDICGPYQDEAGMDLALRRHHCPSSDRLSLSPTNVLVPLSSQMVTLPYATS